MDQLEGDRTFQALISKWNKNDAFPDIMTQLLQTPAPAQPRPPVRKIKSIFSKICLYFFHFRMFKYSIFKYFNIQIFQDIQICLYFIVYFRMFTDQRQRSRRRQEQEKISVFHGLVSFFNLMTLIVKWIQLVSMKNSLFSGWNGNFEKNQIQLNFSELIPKFTITGSANICQQRWEAASKWRQIMSSINRLIEQNRQ